MEFLADGPVFRIAERVFSREAAYRRYREGALNQQEWNEVVDDLAGDLVAAGFPETDTPFLKRIPANPDRMVREILTDLEARGVIPPGGTLAGDESTDEYIHDGKRTFIYPEEGALLAEVTAALKPGYTVFLGSYYGFWAKSALPKLAEFGGSAALVDPDPVAMALAERNLGGQEGPQPTFACMAGEDFLAQGEQQINLVVLDAELPRDHPDPTRRGKALYGHLLRASLPRLAPGAVLVCHNILFQDHTDDPFFDSVIARNREELGAFMQEAEAAFDLIEYPTTEGVGIGKWKG